MAEQLNDLVEYISERVEMTKILCTLPPRFRHLSVAWDNVPTEQQTVESLTLRLLKEESLNHIHGQMDDEGEKAFFSGSKGEKGGKHLSPEEKKKRAAKIAEVKKRTRYNNCGKKGHWANECLEKKEASFEKPDKGKSTSKEVNKSEANAAICEESESDSSAFMAFVGENAEVNKGDI